MPEKAILAPVDGSQITKAAFVEKVAFQVCKRCVMDTTDPHIQFDKSGICSHCLKFDRDIKPSWPNQVEGEKKLEKIISRVKAYGKHRKYDCVIGLSGGVDSSFLATRMVEWGLRPLVVHVDAGWNTEIAVKNIEEICNRLNLELVTHVVEWESMRNMQLAFIKSSLANQDVPQDHAFFAALYKYATKEKIKFVFEGRNFATESVLPEAWGYNAMDAKHVRAIFKKFGEGDLKQFPIVNFFNYHINHLL
jgi:N-acetyl sugar amidotransferase